MGMTLFSLFAAWEAKQENERAAWERARYSAYWSVLPHVKPNSLASITDLGVFEWEREAMEAEKEAKRAALKSAFNSVLSNPEKWQPVHQA